MDALSGIGRDRIRGSPVLAATLIAVGAVVGANLRHALSGVLPGLPATLAANVLGSAALGMLLYEATVAGRRARATRLFLGTGLLSSFTTYSTFVLDAVTATPPVGLAYVIASYGLGFTGVLVGREAARRLAGGASA